MIFSTEEAGQDEKKQSSYEPDATKISNNSGLVCVFEHQSRQYQLDAIKKNEKSKNLPFPHQSRLAVISHLFKEIHR